jgi:putative ABC transport system ATP-binding protein
MTPLVEAVGLTKSYGRTPALRGVSMTITSGEIVAVTGHSGSGKSTLLHCLAGILVPDAGEVRFDGKAISNASERERSRLRRTDIGIVFQFGQLVAELPAVENVCLPLLLSGLSRDYSTNLAIEWLDRFGVGELADALPGEMSGGQLQRVALARALVMSPAVVYADEPTGMLDSLAGEQVMRALTEVTRESGTAVLLVTHAATVAAYADREIRLRDGAVEPAEVTL